MHSTYSRISNAGALATTVLLTILALVSTTTFLIPHSLNLEQSSLKINGLNVVKGISQYDRRGSHYPKEREYAFVKFDLKTDLRPLFNWNTKQVFVSLVADYSTPAYPENSVVLWDRILTSSKHARINLQEARQKYEFKTPESSFGNTTAVYSLHWHVQPFVGVLTEGEIIRTEEIQFPPAKRRSQ
ncbi:signal peptidase complex subunit SPC3 [Sporobolomyces salmoneus]|uniref:signal peptidase complex subunit SPC3 n=1 Tax=Sporobolomyces salmoneus TaxID=183962 RepID=UPI003173F57B